MDNRKYCTMMMIQVPFAILYYLAGTDWYKLYLNILYIYEIMCRFFMNLFHYL